MKFGEAHKYMTFRMYKVLHEDNIPVGEVVTQAKLHEGFINSTLMRILHGLVTPYSPDIIFQEESPQDPGLGEGHEGITVV